MIVFTNTLTGQKQPFVPLDPNNVTLYVCGITPYDYAHIGHGRCYVSFDLLYRFLKLMGYTVTYCRNFTDIDDKLLIRAQNELADRLRYHEIARKYMDSFRQEMKQLNCLEPQCQPLVTQNIPEIIAFIQDLIAKGFAYQVGADVYFHIKKFPAYGQLSKQKLNELQAGARVDVREQKKDPLDFALWKSEPEGTFWKSPWGYGRPGWHIECSAMASTFLGKHIDLHGGGLDLIFPHQENELAQSEARYGAPFVRCWLHGGLILVNKEKMSKSLGNFITLSDIFKEYDPMVLRYYYLSHHYRAPMDFSISDLQAAQRAYQRLCRAFESVKIIDHATLKDYTSVSIIQRMIEFLSDDLNTPGMFGVLFECLLDLSADKKQLALVKTFIDQVLGLTLAPLPEKTITITVHAQRLLDEREKARKEKNFKRADEIRDQLKHMGIDVQDKKTK
jgi:cysteinyl-tRNA synthetase